MLRNQNPHQNHRVTQLLQTVHQHDEQVLEMLSDLLDLRTMFARAFTVFNDCLWTFLSFSQLRLASVFYCDQLLYFYFIIL